MKVVPDGHDPADADMYRTSMSKKEKPGTFSPYVANFTAEAVPTIEPRFTDALVRELIQEEEEAIRGLDYLVTRHRTRLAWLRAVQKGTIKP